MKTGESATLFTVIVNDWSTSTVPSLTLIVTVVGPTLSFVGVPVSSVPSQFNHAGPVSFLAGRLNVKVSPTSTSLAVGV